MIREDVSGPLSTFLNPIVVSLRRSHQSSHVWTMATAKISQLEVYGLIAYSSIRSSRGIWSNCSRRTGSFLCFAAFRVRTRGSYLPTRTRRMTSNPRWSPRSPSYVGQRLSFISFHMLQDCVQDRKRKCSLDGIKNAEKMAPFILHVQELGGHHGVWQSWVREKKVIKARWERRYVLTEVTVGRFWFRFVL